MPRRKALSSPSGVERPAGGWSPLRFFHWTETTLARANAGVSLPCRRGCSYCCHGQDPTVSPADQIVLLDGLRSLPASKRLKVLEKARRLDSVALRELGEPCPLLENDECLVYAHRPLACRLYGSAQSAQGRIFGCDAVRLRLAFTGARLFQISTLLKPFDRRLDSKPRLSLIDWLASLESLSPGPESCGVDASQKSPISPKTSPAFTGS